MTTFLRNLARRFGMGRERQSGASRSTEAIPQLEGDLVFWDLTDPETAKQINAEPGYYVVVKNVSPKQMKNPDPLPQFAMGIMSFLEKNDPKKSPGYMIPLNEDGSIFTDTNKFWRLKAYAYSSDKQVLLVKAEKIGLSSR